MRTQLGRPTASSLGQAYVGAGVARSQVFTRGDALRVRPSTRGLASLTDRGVDEVLEQHGGWTARGVRGAHVSILVGTGAARGPFPHGR